MFNFLKSLFSDGRPNVPTINGVPYDPSAPTSTSRDSRPYQEAVAQAAREVGYSQLKAAEIKSYAPHIDPQIMTGEYGPKVGRACQELQEYNGRR